MWILNEMKRADTVKGPGRRKKKAFRKRNFWCSIYKRKVFLIQLEFEALLQKLQS